MIARNNNIYIKQIVAALGLIFLAGNVAPAGALTPDKNEKIQLKACERRLCKIIVGKKATGQDLSCALKKTWSQKTLKNGGKASKVSWLFGDAQCKADIFLSRATILSALSQRKYKLWLPSQTVNCKVVRSNKVRPVTIIVEPKIVFKKGRAKKIWLNVRRVSGPKDVKGLIWTVAKLEDSIGIFHKSMIKQVNKFILNKCPRVVGGQK